MIWLYVAGTIVDGTGIPRYKADVACQGRQSS